MANVRCALSTRIIRDIALCAAIWQDYSQMALAYLAHQLKTSTLLDIVVTAQWVIWDAPLVTLMGSMTEYVTHVLQGLHFWTILTKLPTQLVQIVPIMTRIATFAVSIAWEMVSAISAWMELDCNKTALAYLVQLLKTYMLLDIVLTAQWVIWDVPHATLMGNMTEYVTHVLLGLHFWTILTKLPTQLVRIVPIMTQTAIFAVSIAWETVNVISVWMELDCNKTELVCPVLMVKT
jgi:hypothetical protein